MSTPALQMSLFSVGTEENLLPLTSSLTPVTLSEASVGVVAAAFVAESRKHAANNAKCQELGWSCILLAVETYGNWRKEAQSVFSSLASLLAISQANPKIKMIAEIYSHPNLSLVRSVAREGHFR